MPLRSDPKKLQAWCERSQAKARAKAAAKSRAPREPEGKPEKPRKRLPKVNEARAEKRRADQFGDKARVDRIKRQPCCCTRAPRRNPACSGGYSDPSHTTSRARGGKADDILPMSRGCHDAWHQHGKLAWLDAVGWTEDDLQAELERFNAEIAEPDPMPE